MNKFVITIGRQFGSGGREIGKLVADRLNIAYYDKELLIEAARTSGVDSGIFEAADERSPRFFANLWPFGQGYSSGSYFMGNTPLTNDSIYRAQSEVMMQLADRGPCVIVGRTADYVLRDYCRVFSIFIHANIEDRIQRIISRGDSKNEEDAKQLADKKNKLRAEYYNFYTDKTWGASESYELSINSSILGCQKTAEFIANYISDLI